MKNSVKDQVKLSQNSHSENQKLWVQKISLMGQYNKILRMN